MYIVEGMRFKNRAEFVKGVADMEYDYDIQVNVNQDKHAQMTESEFAEHVYEQIMSGWADVWSYIDGDCTQVTVPEDVRFLGESTIKDIARDYYQSQKGVA